MKRCGSTVRSCLILRTCPCCRRVFPSERGRIGHQITCSASIDWSFAEQQHDHRITAHGRRH